MITGIFVYGEKRRSTDTDNTDCYQIYNILRHIHLREYARRRWRCTRCWCYSSCRFFSFVNYDIYIYILIVQKSAFNIVENNINLNDEKCIVGARPNNNYNIIARARTTYKYYAHLFNKIRYDFYFFFLIFFPHLETLSVNSKTTRI